MRLYHREIPHLNGYVGNFRLLGIHDQRNLTHVHKKQQEHLYQSSIRGKAARTLGPSPLPPILASSKPEGAQCESQHRTYNINLLNYFKYKYWPTHARLQWPFINLYLVEVAELRLDDVEKQTRLLVERPGGDQQTPVGRHRFPTRDRCSYLWVILVFVCHPVLTTHQHS